MGHHHCRKTKCKAKVTPQNEDKKLFNFKPRVGQGKVTFCDQVKAFPVTKRKCS